MITSLLLGDKKNLLIGGAVVIGLIALASAGSSKANTPALNGIGKKSKKGTPKAKKTSRKSVTIKV